MAIIYDNVLSKEEWEYVYNKIYNGGNWSFTGFSDDSSKLFWFMNLNEDKFFTDIFFNKIQNLSNANFILDRVYANGQTFGLSGELHRDVESDKKNRYFTFLYYPCKEWHVSWNGQTIIIEKENEVNCQYPTPNRGVLFDSTDLHYAEAPSRSFFGLRTTVAFKLTLQ